MRASQPGGYRSAAVDVPTCYCPAIYRASDREARLPRPPTALGPIWGDSAESCSARYRVRYTGDDLRQSGHKTAAHDQPTDLLFHAIRHCLSEHNTLGKLDATNLDRSGGTVPHLKYPRLDGRHLLPALCVVGVVDSATPPVSGASPNSLRLPVFADAVGG